MTLTSFDGWGSHRAEIQIFPACQGIIDIVRSHFAVSRLQVVPRIEAAIRTRWPGNARARSRGTGRLRNRFHRPSVEAIAGAASAPRDRGLDPEVDGAAAPGGHRRPETPSAGSRITSAAPGFRLAGEGDGPSARRAGVGRRCLDHWQSFRHRHRHDRVGEFRLTAENRRRRSISSRRPVSSIVRRRDCSGT